METFKTYIIERFVNLFPRQRKERENHAEHLLNGILRPSYKEIGGIHGNGFETPQDMVDNTHLWKMVRHNGKIVAGAVYKNKPGESGGRKLVAVGGDGSEKGGRSAGKIMVDDLVQKRSHAEVSDKALTSLKKGLLRVGSHINHHIKKYDEAKVFHARNGDEIRRPPQDDPDLKRHPDLVGHLYQRKIGGEWHTKVLVGTANKHLTN
jgi:hypothetical protein